MKDWIKRLTDVTKIGGVYSQSYQDSLLLEIFKNIGTENSPPFCVEFGFNHPDLIGGSGSNVARMVLHEGWRALLLDAEYENHAINLRKHFLTSSNICDIFRNYGVPTKPDYISIDVDSTDLWLFDSILKEYRARVFSVEYNSSYPLDSAVTFPNDSNQFWRGDRGYGASLKALVTVANQHGYSLLWVVPRLDAIFIRNDLVQDGVEEAVFPLEKWRKYTSSPSHPPMTDLTRLASFVDYEVFIKTGDLKESQKAAYLDAKAFLTNSYDWPSLIRRASGLFKKVLSKYFSD